MIGPSPSMAGTSGGGGQGGSAPQAGDAAAQEPAGSGDAAAGAAGGSAGGAVDGGGNSDVAPSEGGGMVDAGIADGGMADRGMDGGGACATALYCDDFESYASPGKPGGKWQTSTAYGGNTNGTVSVDTAHVYRGNNAVHFSTPGNATNEHAFITLQGAPYFPVPDNTFFGRMMVYVTKVPANTVHWTLVEGQGTMVPGFPNLTEAVYRYGGQINGNLLMSNYDTQPGRLSDCAQRSQVKVPMNKWSCVEWRFDGKNKELDLWLDGAVVPALSVRQKANNTGTCQNTSWSGIWEPPTFNRVGVGFQHYQQGAGELWIDDFAIDTKQVGCPPVSATAR
jgi:hypothetical protein